MTCFHWVVDDLELRDLYLHGGSFTWSNEHTNPTLVKLDRALASLDWEELFPYSFLQGLRHFGSLPTLATM